MKITAEQKYIRMSPRKVRLVTYGLRGLNPQSAVKELDYMTRRAAVPVSKVIKQAMANAVNNLKLSPQSLRIAEIQVNEGVTHKRWQAVSRGRAHSIFKRTSHIKVILETVAAKTAPVTTTASAKTVPAPATDQKVVKAEPKTESKKAKPVEKKSVKKTTKKDQKIAKNTKES